MIYTNQGQPSGEAFIQMDSEASAGNASAKMHNKYMELGKKKRYIEVFQCNADDMNLMLSAAPLIGMGPQPQPLPPFMPFTMPQGNYIPPPVTTAIHPMGLIQAPPAVGMNSQIVHPPSLFPHHFPTIPMSSHSGELSLSAARGLAFYCSPKVQFCAPSQADLNMSYLQMLCQSNGFLRQAPSIGIETLYPPPLQG